MILRRGFTLIEMLVALAVLIVALTVVTTVFSVTTQTATQSAAAVELQSLARAFVNEISADLAACDPGQSPLVLVGRTQAAALDEDRRAAGQYFRILTGDPSAVPASFNPLISASPPDPNYSDPRADVLMFFTQRPTSSSAPATNPSNTLQQSYVDGARFAPVQVVYGHAAIDQAAPSGTSFVYAGNPVHIENGGGTAISRLPLRRWHLARRTTIFEYAPGVTSFVAGANGLGGSNDWLLRAQPAANRAGDVARLDVDAYLNSPAGSGVLSDFATANPYQFPSTGGWNATGQNLIYNILYAGGNSTNRHFATIIESPPTDLRSNLALHMLPGCAWFQVEFLLPEDPRNGRRHPDLDPAQPERDDMPRWCEVQPGATYVFAPDSTANRAQLANQVGANGLTVNGTRLDDFERLDTSVPKSLSNLDVRVWPYAIRVTVRVFDRRGRLADPIVRTVVHRFD